MSGPIQVQDEAVDSEWGREGKREDKSETFFYVIIIFVFEFLVFLSGLIPANI
jgi:hypothetical protein